MAGTSVSQISLLILAGFVAGSMNAVAGGGSFVTFPALLSVGLPPVIANACSTVALFPGGLASLWAYRRGIRSFGGLSLAALLTASVLGGLAGALLLLWTPQKAFDAVIPWLLLLATLALAFGRKINEGFSGSLALGAVPMLGAQFVLGLYGGYFGGAVGIMMLAFWSVLGSRDLKSLNPVKTLLVVAANASAVVCFVIAGAVRWPATLAMLAAAVAGGYVGARLGNSLNARVVRAVIFSVTAVITVLFFVRAYRAG